MVLAVEFSPLKLVCYQFFAVPSHQYPFPLLLLIRHFFKKGKGGVVLLSRNYAKPLRYMGTTVSSIVPCCCGHKLAYSRCCAKVTKLPNRASPDLQGRYWLRHLMELRFGALTALDFVINKEAQEAMLADIAATYGLKKEELIHAPSSSLQELFEWEVCERSDVLKYKKMFEHHHHDHGDCDSCGHEHHGHTHEHHDHSEHALTDSNSLVAETDELDEDLDEEDETIPLSPTIAYALRTGIKDGSDRAQAVNAIISTPRSFYLVTEVLPKTREIVIVDLLTETKFITWNRFESNALEVGDIVYAPLLELGKITLLGGRVLPKLPASCAEAIRESAKSMPGMVELSEEEANLTMRQVHDRNSATLAVFLQNSGAF